MTRTQTRIGYALASVVCLGAFVAALVQIYGPGEQRDGVVFALVGLVAIGAVGIHWFGRQLTTDDIRRSKSPDTPAPKRHG